VRRLRRISPTVAAVIVTEIFTDFLQTAMGSAVELEYFMPLARDLEVLDDATYKVAERGVLEVQRMLGSRIRKVGGERMRR